MSQEQTKYPDPQVVPNAGVSAPNTSRAFGRSGWLHATRRHWGAVAAGGAVLLSPGRMAQTVCSKPGADNAR